MPALYILSVLLYHMNVPSTPCDFLFMRCQNSSLIMGPPVSVSEVLFLAAKGRGAGLALGFDGATLPSVSRFALGHRADLPIP